MIPVVVSVVIPIPHMVHRHRVALAESLPVIVTGFGRNLRMPKFAMRPWVRRLLTLKILPGRLNAIMESLPLHVTVRVGWRIPAALTLPIALPLVLSLVLPVTLLPIALDRGR